MASPPDPTRLALEIEHADPLAGRITDAAGEQRSFVGWTGLAAALSGMLDERASDQATDPGRPAGP